MMYDYNDINLKFRKLLYSNREGYSVGNWKEFEGFYSHFKGPPDEEADNVMMCYTSLLYFLGSHYFFQSTENWVIRKFGNLRIRRKVKIINNDCAFDSDPFQSYDIIYQDEQKTLKSTASIKKDNILILLPCHKIVMLDKSSINTFRYSTAKNDTDIKVMNSIRKSIREKV